MKLSRIMVAFGIVFLVLSMPLVLSLNTWTEKSQMPTERGQVAVIAGNDGKIYVIGGWAGVQPLATVEAYDPTHDTWTTKAPLPEATRGAAVAKDLEGKIYVFGGSGVSGPLDTTQIYDPAANSWTAGSSMPTGQWAAGAALGNDGKIYVIGGEESDTALPSNKVQRYDPSTDTWTNRAPMPTGRTELGVVKGNDGLIYAIGGYGEEALSVVEAYNPSTNSWATKAPMPAARVWFGATLGGKIYAIGGGDGSSYLPANEELVTKQDGKIYVIGGGNVYWNNGVPVFDTVFAYDPSANTWTTLTETMLTARRELGVATIFDHVPPTLSITSPTNGTVIKTPNVLVTWTGSDADTGIDHYEVKLDDGTWGSVGTDLNHTFSSVGDGSHTIYVKAVDGAENSKTALVDFTVNTSLLLGPGWMDDILIFAVIAVAVVAIIIVVVLRGKKPKPVMVAPPPPPTG